MTPLAFYLIEYVSPHTVYCTVYLHQVLPIFFLPAIIVVIIIAIIFVCRKRESLKVM